MGKWTYTPKALGIALVLVGIIATISWVLQVPFIMLIFPTTISIMLISSLCFVVAAILFAIPHFYQKIGNITHRLQESENRFKSAFDHAAIGLAIVSLDGYFLKVNKALTCIFGYTENELLKLQIDALIHAEDRQDAASLRLQIFEEKINTYQAEQRYYRRDGQLVWSRVSLTLVKNTSNTPIYYIAQIQDITAEKTAQEQLKTMAYHDPLTGLANRNKLDLALTQLISRASRKQHKFALILLDLDHFKTINDTVGHDQGDQLLKIVAERLLQTVRASDIVVRFGGDEFLIAITDISDVDNVAVIAQKILKSLLQPIMLNGNELSISTSAGISFYPHDGDDLEELLKNADLALYRAKERGRNNYQFCTPEMTMKAQEKLAKQSALNQGLIRNEFNIYYQPKLHLEQNRITGIEALVRWNNEEFNYISAEEVIQLAEESGLIIPLSEWVIVNSCNQINNWKSLGFAGLVLSLNISIKQIRQVDFLESLSGLLNKIHFPQTQLELEITERLILQAPEEILRMLQQIKRAGIHIAVDDFGTGYSSLSYLKSFSVDKIKIDNRFIRNIDTDEDSADIVSAIIAMAKKLDIKTVAEGVENEAQFQFLQREKCTEIQGYYLSPPLPAEDIQTFLMKFKQRQNV